MKRIKYPIKKKRTGKVELDRYSFDNPFRPSRTLKIIFYAVLVILPVFLTYLYLRFAFKQNQVWSFPLDDPWIHLTFAKNLVQYFSFSYFKNEMVTAGSTSPLYTIVVAIGFLITSNEMILSYVIGIMFFVLSAFAFYKLSSYEFQKENVFAMLCTGIFIIDKWINFISVSGMETTMFIFILLLCSYFYRLRKAVPFAVMLGLVMWARPDGVAFIAAIFIDYAALRIYSKEQLNLKQFTVADLKKIGIIFLGIVGIYFAMNMLLSGSMLPNTYSAKLTYYSPEFRSRFEFIESAVWDYFTTGSYYVLMIGFLFSVSKLIFDIYKKTYNQNTLYIAFVLLLVIIYFIKLPYAHRFGRYMMPIIPFFILVATIGFRDLARIINKYSSNLLFSKSIFYIFVGIVFFMGIKDYDENREGYSIHCKYIYDRQVEAALWINENTNENDVIATHDVGAIGYYGNRKIVDVAGLVTPELINKINDRDYVNYMVDYMKSKGVTHLAFLREWFRVSNQNALFSTAWTLPPEVMEVYKFDPEETKILSREANGLLMNAQMLVGQKAGKQIMYVINRMLALEPNSAYPYFYLAYGYYLQEDFINYERNMLIALELFPDFREVRYYLGEYYKTIGRFEEAKVHLTKSLELDPENLRVIEYLKEVSDSLAARQQQMPPRK
ncbi:MAG: hypothetical protein ABIY50_03935 [Ignavibacteria bacterium]